jgi:hypothetical protein
MLFKYPILASASAIVPIAIKQVPDAQASTGLLVSIFLLVLILSAWLSGSRNEMDLRWWLQSCLWAVFGFFAIRWIPQIWHSSKEAFIAFCMSYLIFLYMERTVNSMSYSLSQALEEPVKFVTQKLKKMLPSKLKEIQIEDKSFNADDFRVSAIHEAGHALLFGILDSVPTTLVACVNRNSHYQSNSNYRMVGGRVSAKFEARSHQYQSFVEWEMFLSLAGQESEKAVLGQSCMGSSVDIEDWYITAKRYLRSGCSKLLYFPSPESDWEERANRKSLEVMLNKQRKILSRFFQENLQVLNELSEALIKSEKLEARDLQPFLEKIVRTPGMSIVSKDYSPQI